MSVVIRIRQLCEAQGITLNKLEKETDIGRGNVARWDKHRPNIDKVQKVADYFGVTADYLLTGQKEKPAVSADNGLTDLQQQVLARVKGASETKLRAIMALLGDD